MKSEKYSLGIIPIFYLFLSGSSNGEPEFSSEQSTVNDDDIQQTKYSENELTNRSLQEA